MKFSKKKTRHNLRNIVMQKQYTTFDLRVTLEISRIFCTVTAKTK